MFFRVVSCNDPQRFTSGSLYTSCEHFPFIGVNFLSFSLGYLLTATNKKGLSGWNSTCWTRPLGLRKGCCVLLVDSLCISTDLAKPSGRTTAK